MTDDELYVRGAATLVASWDEYALLERHLGPTEAAAAVDAMEVAYGSAGTGLSTSSTCGASACQPAC
jgi:hypothetical protein